MAEIFHEPWDDWKSGFSILASAQRFQSFFFRVFVFASTLPKDTFLALIIQSIASFTLYLPSTTSFIRSTFSSRVSTRSLVSEKRISSNFEDFFVFKDFNIYHYLRLIHKLSKIEMASHSFLGASPQRYTGTKTCGSIWIVVILGS